MPVPRSPEPSWLRSQLEHRVTVDKRNELLRRRACRHRKEPLDLPAEGLKVGLEDLGFLANLDRPKNVTIFDAAAPKRNGAAGLRVAHPLRMAAGGNQVTGIAA